VLNHRTLVAIHAGSCCPSTVRHVRQAQALDRTSWTTPVFSGSSCRLELTFRSARQALRGPFGERHGQVQPFPSLIASLPRSPRPFPEDASLCLLKRYSQSVCIAARYVGAPHAPSPNKHAASASTRRLASYRSKALGRIKLIPSHFVRCLPLTNLSHTRFPINHDISIQQQ